MKRRLAAIMAADMVGYSRLMEADEAGVLARQADHRSKLIDPAIAEYEGRIVKTTGDGLIVEFANAEAAVSCALAVQAGMAKRETATPPETQIAYRIGINVGDVVEENGDVFGDAVNVAARLEALAEPGGLCLSDICLQMLRQQMQGGFADLGMQQVKNISRPIRVWQWSPADAHRYEGHRHEAQTQKINFCIANDGVQLAWASVGDGPPLLKAPNWINHLDYDWRSPVHGPLLAGLAQGYRLVRFDQRGNGLSDWDVETISEEAMFSDMECVARAAGLDRVALFGLSQGCSFAVRYAVAHPESVACMVLLGGYARGQLRRGKPAQEAIFHATTTLIEQGWGAANPAFRHLFTENFLPEASASQKASMDETQRLATSPGNAKRIVVMNANVDVCDLARRVTCPVLVAHCEHDRAVPMDEGRRLAALIPNAEFLTLPGANHVPVTGTPAFDLFMKAYRGFLAKHYG